MPGMLEVVARVCLVRDEPDQRGRADRQVDVHVDPRAETAVVPVVAGPGLARHERGEAVRDSPVGQPRTVDPGPIPGNGDQPVEQTPGRRSAGTVIRSSQAASRSRRSPRPGTTASSFRGDRPRSEPVAASDRRRVEAALHEIEVRQRLAGQCPGVGRQGDELDAQPVAASRVRRPRRPGPIDEPRRILDQGGRVTQSRFEVDLRLEVGGAEIPVDQPRDPLVQPQREEQVVAGDRIRGRDVALAADRRHHGSAASRAGRRRTPACRGPAVLTDERHRLPLDGVEAHPEELRSSARRPHERRPPPRPDPSVGPGRCPSACRPSATRGDSDPSCPRRRSVARRTTGATSGAPWSDGLATSRSPSAMS